MRQPTVLALAAFAFVPSTALAVKPDRRLVVLGVDGMDPKLTGKLMREGKMPNLSALAAEGGFIPLATSNPPQSPVAWSTFITGMDTDGHGIYDFVHRDPATRMPYLSTSRTEDPEILHLGPLLVPMGSGKIELLRAGRAFWDILADHGVPSILFQIPANYPPNPSELSRNMSGMGTPDLLGTYGTFEVVTDDAALAKKKVDGGIMIRVDFRGGTHVHTSLKGPPNPLSKAKEPMLAPLEIVRSKTDPVVLVRIGGSEHLLAKGEWTAWIPVELESGGVMPGIKGIVRLYLKSLEPFVLYASPLNIDPLDPAQPIASVPEYSADVAREAGRFYTQGMPEDTKALEEGILTADEFLEQAKIVEEERKPLLDWHLAHFDKGLLFFYFSSIDQVSHMFWSAMDADAPPDFARYSGVVPALYEEMDRLIGKVMKWRDSKTDLMVMSDHGFTSWKYEFHLNAWLAERGWLTPRKGAKFKAGSWRHVDWTKTKAYAIGINQLFINLKGRETGGIVSEAERETVAREIARDLESWRDPETGQPAVTRVFITPEGKFPDRAPDMLVGYNLGWRSSNQSALGDVPDKVFEKNNQRWNGDHCMDPVHVPGTLVSGVRLSTTTASLMDLAPTILTYFGVTPPAGMRGRNILGETP